MAHTPYVVAATLTNGSKTVTALPAIFTAQVKPGDWMRGPDEKQYFVDAVVSNNEITLDRNYLGATTTAEVSFARHSDAWGVVADAASRLARIEEAIARGYTLTSNTAVTVSSSGAITLTVEAGLNILPGIRMTVASRSDLDDVWMSGIVTAYSGSSMTIEVDSSEGSGSHADWNINIAGSQGPTGATGATGPRGNPGGEGAIYTYSATTTDADPGNGVVRLNNATLASVTMAYVDLVNAAAADLTDWLDSLDNSTNSDKAVIRLARNDAPETNFAIYYLTGVTTATGYRKLSLTYIDHAGSLNTTASNLMLSVQRIGDKGTGAVDSFNGRAGAVTPAASDYDASQIDNDSGVTGATVKDALDALRTGKQGSLPTTKGTIPVGNGSSIVGLPVGANGTTLVADSAESTNLKWQTPAESRVNLGLGTAALKNTGTSGDAVPLLNQPQTFSGDTLFENDSAPISHSVINNAAPTAGAMIMRRARGSVGSPSAVLSGDVLGGLNVRGYGSTGYSSLGRASFSFRAIENWTDSAQGTDFVVETTAAGGVARTARMLVKEGIYTPGATGGDRGANTINAGAVYDDNTLLTCMAMADEFIESGTVDLEKWDALAPDLVIPEQTIEEPVVETIAVTKTELIETPDGFIARNVEALETRPVLEWTPIYDESGNGLDAIAQPVIEIVVVPEKIVPRVHRTARVFATMLADGFDPRDPDQYFAKMRTDEALPGMPNQADWVHGDLSSGEIHSRLWLATEMLAIVTHVMWGRLIALERRVDALDDLTI